MVKKEVAVLLPRINYGGVTRVSIEILKRLEKIDGLSFTVYSNRVNAREWFEELEDTDLREFSPLPYPELAYHRPDIRRELEDYDAIWNHNQYLNRLSRTLRTPIISVNHTYHSFRRPKWIARPWSLKTKLNRYCARRGIEELQHTDRVIAVSDRIKRRSEDIYKANADRIYNGGNSDWTEFSEKDEGFIFAPDSAGSTVDSCARDKDVRSLSGSGSDNIEDLGWVSDKELAKNYKECSFIISDSWKEGFAVYPIEAAFCGKPAVLRDAGGNSEFIEHGETGFIAKNSAEFHEYVNRLWSDEELRKEMGRKAYERAKDRFTWERASKEYLVEFNDLMGSDFNLDV
jgi:glycosyltransferase involved in cell wall biosynthesis